MNIFEAISACMAEIGAVGKDSRNSQQNFMYRGIDAVMNAINPALVHNKVFIVPTVLEQTREERTNSKGTTLIYSIIKVNYKFYAEDGSFIEATVIGEGMDSGDKATNKAMSVAFKYACFQVFCIPTEEMVDPDSECHEVKAKPAEPRLITSVEKVELLKEMNRTGMSKQQLLEWAKVETIDDLTDVQCQKAMAQLKTFKDAQ